MGGCFSSGKSSRKSKASKDEEKHELQGEWSELPSLPLEMIYSFLSRDDQVNMSVVCRSWSEGYGSPSVWRTFRFELKVKQLSKNTYPGMKFVQNYSSMFRRVNIMGPGFENFNLMTDFCKHGSSSEKCLVKKWCRIFIEFLQILTRNTQLMSIVFQYFAYCLEHVDTPTYNDLTVAIAEFLSSQRHLKRVEFNRCPFRYQESAKVLRIAFESSKNSLAHIKLRWFLKDDINDIQMQADAAQNLPLLADLPNLKTLDTDYSFIFENMVKHQSNAIQTVRNFQILPLSKLIVDNCHSIFEMGNFQGLTPTDWRLLKAVYPDLQIELSLTVDGAERRVFEFFISPYMPISRLNYTSVDFIDGSAVPVLFDHLIKCKINEHLVSLKMDWDEPRQHFSSTINPFLQTCKTLKFLEIYMLDSTAGIDVMLKPWLERRPESLESAFIDVTFIKDEIDLTGVENITKYVSVLNLTGLKVSVMLHKY